MTPHLSEQRSDVRDQRTASASVEPAVRREVRGQRSEVRGQQSAFGNQTPSSVLRPPSIRVALLTGGGDKPYALGMAAALTSVGIHVDFVGSDDLSVPELLANPRLNFLNLRGDQREDASTKAKVLRVLKYTRGLLGMRQRQNQSCSTFCGITSSSSSTAAC